MRMSSSEDDYMSDTFLTGCIKEDIRPGLIHSRSEQRSHEILKKKTHTDEINKSVNQPKGFLETEFRENALNQPIASDNKGFAMLQKLGFKPGSGLGKSGSGRTEPVPVKLKNDRQGLGRTEALKEIAQMKANFKKEVRNKLMNVENYRSHLAEKAAEKRAIIDLGKSQRVCKQLDTDSGILEPEEVWFWPNYERKEADDVKSLDDDLDDSNPNVWTGDDKSRDGISSENEDEEKGDGNNDDPEWDDYDDYTVKEKLEMLTIYLRETYYYCIWCAVQYDDDRDLRKECPGPTYDDH